MLKAASSSMALKPKEIPPKSAAGIQQTYVGPLASGLNRRAFLKTASALTLLAGLPACKPKAPDEAKVAEPNIDSSSLFNPAEIASLDAVYLQLFPADGNGPSAQDINMLEYLQWALSDSQNIEDGDPTFIKKGIGWLEQLAEQTQGEKFVKLAGDTQDKLLKQIAQSNAGENWLSLLLYYLTEALLLDPVYGGNPNGIGWQWLEHQSGFPAPVVGKTYRDFE